MLQCMRMDARWLEALPCGVPLLYTGTGTAERLIQLTAAVVIDSCCSWNVSIPCDDMLYVRHGTMRIQAVHRG